MEHQLQLLEDREEWRLDDDTRERGRQGVAEARAVLAQLRRPGAARHAA
ncbi:MAG TPA: hypothetical protein VHE80_01900 [Acidimicrobiales bacterium]|nr:hypothetical protein [Acidimicrobiales bacterium]